MAAGGEKSGTGVCPIQFGRVHSHRAQTLPLHRRHLRAARRAALATQTPSTLRTIPGPHPSRTMMTMPSGCWRGTVGMACTDDAKANPTTTNDNLIIGFLSLFLEITAGR